MAIVGKLATASLLTLSVATNSLAQDRPDLGSSNSDVGRILAMDITGVRLRMAPTQARAALRQAGYAPTPDPNLTNHPPKVERNYDYAARLDQARHQRLSDGGPSRTSQTIVGEDWNKGDERVHVTYVPLRDGIEVSDVLYTIPDGRIGWDGIRSSVITRYGQPTRLSEARRSVRYCGDEICAAVGANFAEMSLEIGWRLELSDGGALERLSREQAARDADQSIAKTGKPSF